MLNTAPLLVLLIGLAFVLGVVSMGGCDCPRRLGPGGTLVDHVAHPPSVLPQESAAVLAAVLTGALAVAVVLLRLWLRRVLPRRRKARRSPISASL